MTARDHRVFVVDHDASIQEALFDLLSSSAFEVEEFRTATDFLQSPRPDLPSCLIMEMNLPDMDGFALQRRITETCPLPIIFISCQEDIPTTVRAIKCGAIQFFTKPFDPLDLLNAVCEGIAQDRKDRIRRAELAQLEQRYATLTPREREVMPLIVSGLLNKQAASELGITKITLQIHRGQVMRKMRAESFADLVRMAGKLDMPLPCRAH